MNTLQSLNKKRYAGLHYRLFFAAEHRFKPPHLFFLHKIHDIALASRLIYQIFTLSLRQNLGAFYAKNKKHSYYSTR